MTIVRKQIINALRPLSQNFARLQSASTLDKGFVKSVLML